MPPTSRAGANQTLPFGSTTAGLDGTASTASAGAIVAWLWTMLYPTDGSVTLTNPTTATPTLTFTGPGPARVALNVQQTDLSWAFTPIGTDPDVVYTLPVAMPTAYTEVTVLTQYAGLSIPAVGERHDERVDSPNDLQAKWVGLFNAVDAQAGIDPAPAGSQQATRYVTAEAGPIDADGSASNPFNATSAATASFDGPWNQAIASLIAGGTAAELGYTVYAYGGAYNEDVTISADRQWMLGILGTVTFDAGNDFLYTFAASQLSQANFIVSPVADGINITLPRVGIGNPVAQAGYIFWRGVAAISVNVTGTCLAGLQANLEQCFISHNFNIPNLSINYALNTTFGVSTADLTVGSLVKATDCTFSDDITVTAAGGASSGFYDCIFAGTPLWTGPAASAKFDPVTARRFVTAGGTFAGGAGKADFLPITTSSIVIDDGAGTGYLTTNVINTAATTDLTITSSDDMSISAGDELNMGGGGAVSLTAGAGADVTITGGSTHGVVLAGGAGSTYDAAANIIAERTAASGVTIDGVLCKDNSVTVGTAGFVVTDEVQEKTVANGVLVDQVLLQDTTVRATRVYTSGGNDLSLETATIALLFDESKVQITSSADIVATNRVEAVFPIGVRPNDTYQLPGAATHFKGTLVGVAYTAAVAATSATGDISIRLHDASNDDPLTDSLDIDGITSASFTITQAAFLSGFYPAITSTNVDALQGYGMVVSAIYYITDHA